MEAQSEENKPSPEEPKGSSTEQNPSTPEEPIILNKLFPGAQKDLDTLFPEPEMKKLLKDLVRTRQRNERFLKKIDLGEFQGEDD